MIKSKMDFKPRTQLTPTKFETAVFSFADRGEAEALGALLRLLKTRSRFFQSELARIRTMSGQNWPDGQPEYAINSGRFGWILSQNVPTWAVMRRVTVTAKRRRHCPKTSVIMAKVCQKHAQKTLNYGQNMARIWPEYGQSMAKLP